MAQTDSASSSSPAASSASSMPTGSCASDSSSCDSAASLSSSSSSSVCVGCCVRSRSASDCARDVDHWQRRRERALGRRVREEAAGAERGGCGGEEGATPVVAAEWEGDGEAGGELRAAGDETEARLAADSGDRRERRAANAVDVAYVRGRSAEGDVGEPGSDGARLLVADSFCTIAAASTWLCSWSLCRVLRFLARRMPRCCRALCVPSGAASSSGWGSAEAADEGLECGVQTARLSALRFLALVLGVTGSAALRFDPVLPCGDSSGCSDCFACCGCSSCSRMRCTHCVTASAR